MDTAIDRPTARKTQPLTGQQPERSFSDLQIETDHYGEDRMSEEGGGRQKPTAYNRVAALRRAEGISRKSMADSLGMSPETLAYIERQEREPGVLLGWRISEFFNLPLELMFSDEPLAPLLEILRDHYSRSSQPRLGAHSRTSSQTGRG